MIIAFHCHIVFASPVFQIEKDTSISYLVGTIHLLNASDHPLPKSINTAFENASVVVYETEMDKVNSPAHNQEMIAALTLPNGMTIKEKLKPETYSQLLAYMQLKNLPIQRFKNFSPAGLSLMLTVIESHKQGYLGDLGVEQTYFKHPDAASKQHKHLEAFDDHISFLANLGQGHENEMIASTIEQLDNFSDYITDIKRLWLAGDLDGLDHIANRELRADYPKTYQSLLVKRNNNWLPLIKEMNQDKAVDVIMVGALHLAGPDGLVKKLRDAGYKVTPFKVKP